MVILNQNIVEVDDFCQQFIAAWEASLLESGEKQRRKPSRLSTSEVMTLLVLSHRYRYRNFKTIYQYMQVHLKGPFSESVSYTRMMPLTNMTLLHYPPQLTESKRMGIHPHKDTDGLAILAPDPVGGLMVRHRDGSEWIGVDPPGDALNVNIGDLLEVWSGGYLVSTPHKVINTSGTERYSFRYFAVPRFIRHNRQAAQKRTIGISSFQRSRGRCIERSLAHELARCKNE